MEGNRRRSQTVERSDAGLDVSGSLRLLHHRRQLAKRVKAGSNGRNECGERESPDCLTLAAIAATGLMTAMKTDASAAEDGAILPVMSCEALVNSDFTALDARIATSATGTRNGHSFCDVKATSARSPSSRRSCPLRLGVATICSKAAEGCAARPM
jgi:hypothetical protein